MSGNGILSRLLIRSVESTTSTERWLSCAILRTPSYRKHEVKPHRLFSRPDLCGNTTNKGCLISTLKVHSVLHKWLRPSQTRAASTKTSAKCWKCQSLIDTPPTDQSSAHPADHFFCQNKDCGALQPAYDVNHFEQFRLPVIYDIDTTKLTKSYKRIQQRLHPDKSTQLAQEEKEFADKHSTAVNEAYETLLKPVSRALYLLHINGLSLEEKDVVLDPQFLMHIMEINEVVSDDYDEASLRVIFDDNRSKINELIKEIAQAFERHDFAQAKLLTAKIKYFVNIEDKIKEKTYFH